MRFCHADVSGQMFGVRHSASNSSTECFTHVCTNSVSYSANLGTNGRLLSRRTRPIFMRHTRLLDRLGQDQLSGVVWHVLQLLWHAGCALLPLTLRVWFCHVNLPGQMFRVWHGTSNSSAQCLSHCNTNNRTYRSSNRGAFGFTDGGAVSIAHNRADCRAIERTNSCSDGDAFGIPIGSAHCCSFRFPQRGTNIDAHCGTNVGAISVPHGCPVCFANARTNRTHCFADG